MLTLKCCVPYIRCDHRLFLVASTRELLWTWSLAETPVNSLDLLQAAFFRSVLQHLWRHATRPGWKYSEGENCQTPADWLFPLIKNRRIYLTSTVDVVNEFGAPPNNFCKRSASRLRPFYASCTKKYLIRPFFALPSLRNTTANGCHRLQRIFCLPISVLSFNQCHLPQGSFLKSLKWKIIFMKCWVDIRCRPKPIGKGICWVISRVGIINNVWKISNGKEHFDRLLWFALSSRPLEDGKEFVEAKYRQRSWQVACYFSY